MYKHSALFHNSIPRWPTPDLILAICTCMQGVGQDDSLSDTYMYSEIEEDICIVEFVCYSLQLCKHHMMAVSTIILSEYGHLY